MVGFADAMIEGRYISIVLVLVLPVFVSSRKRPLLISGVFFFQQIPELMSLTWIEAVSYSMAYIIYIYC